MKQASLAGGRRTIVAVGTVVTMLGASGLVSGLTNLAIAPAITAIARQTSAFQVPPSAIDASMAIVFLVTQNWLIWVTVQLAFAAIVFAAGIAFLRRRSWARVFVEGLGWTGVAILAIPVVWIARWVLATPADRVLGFWAGLQTMPSGVGRPVATVLEFFVSGAVEWGWWLLGQIGLIHWTPATQLILAWTSAGVFVGTVASVGIPTVSVILLVLVRRWQIREAFSRGAP